MAVTARAYYWIKRPNFGDLLTPLILAKFSRIESVWARPADAQIVVTGSIIEHLPPDWGGIVAGAGRLHPEPRALPNAQVLAVRGPLSAKGFTGWPAIGDPALLADELVPKTEKRYHLGLVPHWSDTTLEMNPIFARYHPLVIRVGDDPHRVISQIASCRKIVASALHGIILADAFGIPRRVEIAPAMTADPAREGGLFKWQDYHASLGMDLVIGVTREADRNRVVERQHEIFDVLTEVGSLFGSA